MERKLLYKPEIYLDSIYRKIMVIPDLHAPWVNWAAIKQAHKWYKRHKPDLVIQIGDLTDQKIWSRHQKDVDDSSPTEELLAAEKVLKKMYKMFPKMVILRGNHDLRAYNKAVEAGIPSQMFKDINQVFDYDGWSWVPRNLKLVVRTPRGRILFVHGDEQGGTVAQKSRLLGMSIIQGHTHKVSITYTTSINTAIFGAEMGCIMDVDSKAARYAAPNPVGVTVGFGIVKYGVPYFLSYNPNTIV